MNKGDVVRYKGGLVDMQVIRVFLSKSGVPRKQMAVCCYWERGNLNTLTFFSSKLKKIDA
jgi:hypothetical protein